MKQQKTSSSLNSSFASFDHAEERKKIKYEDLVCRAKLSGYKAHVISLEVGSRGLINWKGFSQLKDEFHINKKDLNSQLVRVSQILITESYKIWCRRNTVSL